MKPVRLDHTFFERETRPHLGAILLSKRWLTPEQLDEALDERTRTSERLGEILLRRQWIFEEDLARALSEQSGLEYVDISTISVDANAAMLLPRDVAERVLAVPVRYVSPDTVLVAVGDPTEDPTAELEGAMGVKVRLAVTEGSSIESQWRRLGR